MNSDKRLKILGELLVNDTSMMIIKLLSKKEQTVTELMKNLKFNDIRISRHILKLREYEFVSVIKKPGQMYNISYKMKPEFHINVLRKIVDNDSNLEIGKMV